ncbi:MAG TPA: hypothetical protein VMW87_16135 [Spirochaetia bacterium]|nr:hypothetical protein [Spirochaetia bacterium]
MIDSALKEDDFPHELSTFLFDFAERIFETFPPNQNQPRNLMTAYLECVLYLVARMDLLLGYLNVAEAQKERVLRVILSQIEEEFGTANSTSVAEVVAERMAQYEKLFSQREPFTDGWYERVFSFFAARIDESIDDTRRYVWNLTQEAHGARPLTREEILDAIRRSEIEDVVTFQRIVINFFTRQEEDDE